MKIYHRTTGAVLYDGEHKTMREAVEVANLSVANLRVIRDDLREVLAASPAEAPGLLAAIREGRINGTVYEGVCACLVGTLANLRHCRYTEIPGLAPDSSRPAERWFLALTPGRTPENDQVAAITAGWVEEWLTEHAEVATP